MAPRWRVLLLDLQLFTLMVMTASSCPLGFNRKGKKCFDIDECAENPARSNPCGHNSICSNTNGSFYCRCEHGYKTSTGNVTFLANAAQCLDINECAEFKDICGPNALCYNAVPSYYCVCKEGFITTNGTKGFTQGDNVTCADICLIDKSICGNGTCHQGDAGHYCTCHAGFSNYGNNESSCTELNCDVLTNINDSKEILNGGPDFEKSLKRICSGEGVEMLNGEKLLKEFLSIIDELLSSGALNENSKISTFLDIVENVLRILGPFMKNPRTRQSSETTELDLFANTGTVLPQGAVTMSCSQTQLNMQLETAAGAPSLYPGFTTVSLLSYTNLFRGMKPENNKTFKINSKVVTITVSNRNTSRLDEPVEITFNHLEQTTNNHTCAFWDSSEDGGSWSSSGCSVVESNHNYTVCSCSHLSSFAVLMSLYEMEHKFELQLITWVGLSLSLVCLFLCILTFSLIRSIQSPRNTIHLHLCISLFVANLVFLAGISRTENQVGCAVVAGLLHFFYLAAFCWMCLEGIQLFRMVILVFNTNFKPLYMMAGGYGIPALIVTITALANPSGYGTKRYCWLSLNSIWSFFGPACVIIIINIFFFLVTVWKLAQKFSSLNPDLDNLHKIKAFTITAVAQLCVLGTMWIFGCFQFEQGTIAMSYLFTIFGSFQGVMLFVMHCLFSKQVREEYENILSTCCAPQKKRYSEFSSSHSSKAHGPKSTQDTGESRI